jgi:hypothetical protein
MFDRWSGVATTRFGPLLRTTNGGFSWQPLVGPHQQCNDVLLMDLVAPSTLVLYTRPPGTFSQKMFRSTNMGESWDSSFGEIPFLTSIEMVTPSIGYATGNHVANGSFTPSIFKSTNGGLEWISVFDTALTDWGSLAGVTFRDVNNGLVFGKNGLILSTSNGGLTWDVDHVELSEGVDIGNFVNAIHIKGSRPAAAGGDGEIVVRQDKPLLARPDLLTPSYGNAVSKKFNAVWKSSPGAERYQLRLLRNALLRPVLASEDNLTDTTYQLPTLTDYSYFIEVRALSKDNQSNWSKVHFATTGVADVRKQVAPKYLLSPNPSLNRVISVLGLTDAVQVFVIDILGNTLTTALLDPTSNQLDLRALPAGSYIVSVHTGEKVESIRLILK